MKHAPEEKGPGQSPADGPIDVSLDWREGTATIIAPAAVKVGLRVEPGEAPRVDGAARPPADPGQDGLTTIALEPGEHTIEFSPAEPGGPSEADLSARFETLAAEHAERLAKASVSPAPSSTLCGPWTTP